MAGAASPVPGRVVGWGVNWEGQADSPDGLTDAVAVAAGDEHSLALRADGTVVAWGADDFGEATPPSGLADVVAVAGGGYHSLALRSDGTVVAWGNNRDGQIDVPAGLADVVAIAAGAWYSLALRSDGTLVSWGYWGRDSVPSGLGGVVAIDASAWHSLAIMTTPAATPRVVPGTVTVDYVTLFGPGVEPPVPAAPGVDFGSVSGTVTFAPGETAKTVAVPVFGDTAVEPDEWIVLSFGRPVNARMGGYWGLGFGVIANDD